MLFPYACMSEKMRRRSSDDDFCTTQRVAVFPSSVRQNREPAKAALLRTGKTVLADTLFMSSIYIRQGRRRCRTMKVNFPRCLDCCRRICQLILFRRIFVVLKRKFKPIVSYCFLLQFNKHSVTSRSENFNDVGGKER